VVKSYSQKLGIDYDEVFALVARLETIREVCKGCSQEVQNEGLCKRKYSG
jgi:hypothetical protein